MERKREGERERGGDRERERETEKEKVGNKMKDAKSECNTEKKAVKNISSALGAVTQTTIQNAKEDEESLEED